jgi:hypothetical protein
MDRNCAAIAEGQSREETLQMVTHTLDKMAAGVSTTTSPAALPAIASMNDGSCHILKRCCTDNALLTSRVSDAFQATGHISHVGG